jgi:hypothetical protein
MILKKYKRDILWTVITLQIMIAVSIVQMYSRDVTLYKIQKNQFKIYKKILDKNRHSCRINP